MKFLLSLLVDRFLRPKAEFFYRWEQLRFQRDLETKRERMWRSLSSNDWRVK